MRKLAVSVATGRIAGVFLEENTVIATKTSRTAAGSTQNAARIIQSWINGFGPDHLIVEDPKTALRKGNHARALLQTIRALFDKADGLCITLSRVQSYQNKYEEAKALAARYPEIAHLLPQRPPIWRPEPRNMSYFEALSFVEQLRR